MAGIVTLVRFRQPPKVAVAICVTPEGILTDVSDSHPEKASCPMLVTVAGIVTLVRFSQYAKAESPIAVTPEGTVISSADFLQAVTTCFAPSEYTRSPSTVPLRVFAP